MKSFILSLIIVFIAVSAQAGGKWNKQLDNAGGVCDVLKPAQTCYYDFADTTDPDTLDVSQCLRGITYWLEPDEDGASTGCEVQPYRCTEDSFSTNHCTKILNDTTGDGIPNDVTLDGTTVLRIGRENVTMPFFGCDVTANASSDDCRIVVGCY